MECHGQIATRKCCNATPATTHGITLRNGETRDAESLILGIRQFYDFARGAANGLQAEGEALRGEDYRIELICPHVHDCSRGADAIDDSRIAGKVFGRQVRGGVVAGVDGGGTRGELEIGSGNEERIGGNVPIDSVEFAAAVTVGDGGIIGIVVFDDRRPIVVNGVAEDSRLISRGRDDVVFDQDILVKAISIDGAICAVVYRTNNSVVDECKTFRAGGN